jgi:Xaa-Pro aminopeptidase
MMDHQARQAKLRNLLPQHRLESLLVTHLPNVRYLCGFTGSAGALLLTAKNSVFFTDGRYKAQAQAEVQEARIVVERKSPLAAAGDWLAAQRRTRRAGRPSRLGVEAGNLTHSEYLRLEANLPNFRLRPAPPIIEQNRMEKDADEIKLIRAAVTLGARLFKHALTAIRPGVKESEVAAKMEYAARKAGAEGMSFPTIIASGKRSALPHGTASDAVIRSGFVVCDFGVILAGYCSDRTRTVFVGRPTPEARRMYDAVLQAQEAAIASVKPGRTVGEVDRAARKLLQKAGLGKFFTHSTGHGVGLEIHEAPRLAAGQSETLKPGMVITIEPGVYIPGKWGVRIEDIVLVTEKGCEVLTPANKALITL